MTNFKHIVLFGGGGCHVEIRKRENIYLNMPEASENTMKANIICEEGNPNNLPQKIRKTQMIATKRL